MKFKEMLPAHSGGGGKIGRARKPGKAGKTPSQRTSRARGVFATFMQPASNEHVLHLMKRLRWPGGTPQAQPHPTRQIGDTRGRLGNSRILVLLISGNDRRPGDDGDRGRTLSHFSGFPVE